MKRIISLIAAGILVFSTLTSNAYADVKEVGKYKDIKNTDWYAEAVDRLSAMNIVNGMADGSFKPQGEVTRAQFVKMVVQAMEYKKIDSLSFDDLKPFQSSKPHWASVYVETALRNGVIVKEEIGDNFYPDVPLTRKDMAMMMFRALKLEQSAGENPFIDLSEANGCFIRLYEEYLIGGTLQGGKRLYKPEGLTTRAEAAAIISRMVEYKADPVAYKAKMKAEDDYKALVASIKAGNYTEEDLIVKSKIELEKQKADKAYIPEPILKVVDNPDKASHAWISLLNYRDYMSDFSFKMHCNNYPEINTDRYNSLMGLQTHTRDNWQPIDGRFVIPEWNGRFVGKSCEYYQYNFKTGTVFIFTVTYKRGNILKSFDYSVAIK